MEIRCNGFGQGNTINRLLTSTRRTIAIALTAHVYNYIAKYFFMGILSIMIYNLLLHFICSGMFDLNK